MGNENQQEVEREISILDLLYFVLKQWRKLFLAGIIGLLLFVALFVWKNKKIIFVDKRNVNIVEITASVNENNEVTFDDYNTTISTMNYAMSNYMTLLNGCKEYQENSILMKFDAFNVPTKYVDFVIDRKDDVSFSDGNAIANSMVENYYTVSNNAILNRYATTYFVSEFDWEELSKITDIPVVYLKEIVTISTYGGDAFRVTIRHYDENVINDILKFVKEQVEKFKPLVVKATYQHNLTCLENPIVFVYDNVVLNKQVEISNKIRDYTNLISDVKTKMTKYQKENSGASTNVVGSISIKKLVKYMIIGAFLGCFIVAFIYFCIYIFTGKLHTDDELKSMFGTELFGVIITKSKSNKLFEFIDKFIQKIFKHFCYNDEYEDAIKRVALFVENLESKNITIMSVSDTEKIKTIISKIQDILKNKKLLFIGNIISSTDSMKNLVSTEEIVLIEELENSKMSDICLEYNIAKTFNKRITGYVVLAESL